MTNINEIKRLEKKAFQIRKQVLEMCVKATTGHVTSSMSSAELMVALYQGGILKVNPSDENDPNRDRFILSKGQASPILYAILADMGFYDTSELDKFAQKDGIFGVHLQSTVPGVEITAGALGHGFGVAAGIALAAKQDRDLHLTVAMLGDGELYEGSIWETAMFASHNRLNNLVGIIDRNYLCVTDFTENLIALEPLDKKWEAFGWDVKRIDGNSIEEIMFALKDVRSRRSSKPLMIIADTVKGNGVESMSNIPLTHGVPPDSGKATETARQDLNDRYNDLS